MDIKRKTDFARVSYAGRSFHSKRVFLCSCLCALLLIGCNPPAELEQESAAQPPQAQAPKAEPQAAEPVAQIQIPEPESQPEPRKEPRKYIVPKRPPTLTFQEFLKRNRLLWKFRNLPSEQQQSGAVDFSDEIEEKLFSLMWQFQSRAKREWSTGHIDCDPEDPTKIVELIIGVTSGTSGCMGCCDQDLNSYLTDADLEGFEYFTDLRKLSIVWSDITGVGLKSLENLEDLKELKIVKSPLSDAGLAQIGRLKQVERITISQSVFDSDALKELAACTSLQSLMLRNCRLSAEAWEGLGQLGQLKKLWVNTPEHNFETVTYSRYDKEHGFHESVDAQEIENGRTEPNDPNDPEQAFDYLKHLATMGSLEEFYYQRVGRRVPRDYGCFLKCGQEDYSRQQDLKQIIKSKSLKKVTLNYRSEPLSPHGLWLIANRSKIEEVEIFSGYEMTPYRLGRSETMTDDEGASLSAEEVLAQCDTIKTFAISVEGRDTDADAPKPVEIYGMNSIETLLVRLPDDGSPSITIRDMPSLLNLRIIGDGTLEKLRLENLPLLTRLEMEAPESLEIENVGTQVHTLPESKIRELNERTLVEKTGAIEGPYHRCSVSGNLSDQVAAELAKIESIRLFVFSPSPECRSRAIETLAQQLPLRAVNLQCESGVAAHWTPQLVSTKETLVFLRVFSAWRDQVWLSGEDLKPLAELENLKYLYLGHVNDPSVNPLPWLSDLKQLEGLWLEIKEAGSLQIDFDNGRLKHCEIDGNHGPFVIKELTIENWNSPCRTIWPDTEWAGGHYDRAEDSPLDLNLEVGNLIVKNSPDVELIVMPRSSNLTVEGDMENLKEIFTYGFWDDGKYGKCTVRPTANVPNLKTIRRGSKVTAFNMP